ncbi:MAG TPA: carboxymuconolactone decarboxylase family protein [Kofleriaceae bacterium]|nr:carboxymuconolactone decarboxylase family protein [Kofleriaceae bacterium]
MRLDTVAPAAMKAMLELEGFVRGAVEHDLLELIKLRASMLNGCAFCVDMHATDALRSGEAPRRLFAVSAWRESPFFTPTERAALALTDAVTELGRDGVPDAVWREAAQVWSPEQLAGVLMAIVTINAWNRIAVSTHAQPPPLK